MFSIDSSPDGEGETGEEDVHLSLKRKSPSIAPKVWIRVCSSSCEEGGEGRRK